MGYGLTAERPYSEFTTTTPTILDLLSLIGVVGVVVGSEGHEGGRDVGNVDVFLTQVALQVEERRLEAVV